MTEKRQTSQGYIIRILQHFATKLRNITCLDQNFTHKGKGLFRAFKHWILCLVFNSSYLNKILMFGEFGVSWTSIVTGENWSISREWQSGSTLLTTDGGESRNQTTCRTETNDTCTSTKPPLPRQVKLANHKVTMVTHLTVSFINVIVTHAQCTIFW
jgi:hypothetical protein